MDDAYKQQIEDLLADKYDYIFITDYLSDTELVALRKVTDVLIEVQTDDALNATMLETMYAGGEVITGSWLPYKDIYDRGVKMRQVDAVDDVGSEMRAYLTDPMSTEERQNNRAVIEKLYRWENIIGEWAALYEE